MTTPRAAQVAVVGAGISGVACARALRAAGVEPVLLERARVVGGRLASRRLPAGADRSTDRYTDRYTDLGASYFTVTDAGFQAVVDDWAARGLARPWTDTFGVLRPGTGLARTTTGPVRWAATGGLRSLVADLAGDLAVRTGVAVRTVTGSAGGPAVDGTRYAAVVLALPDPQALGLLGPELGAERAATAGRAWRPVLALAAGFTDRPWDGGAFVDGAFVEGSEVLAWVADDGRRRGDGAPVLVAHSTGPWAAARLAEPEQAGPGLLAELARTVPGLDGVPPAWTHVHRWTYAAPEEGREAEYHLGPARVGLCGDGWGRPRVETAWRSGTLLGAELGRQLG